LNSFGEARLQWLEKISIEASSFARTNNSRELWKTLNRLRGKRTALVQSKVTPTEWMTYFRELLFESDTPCPSLNFGTKNDEFLDASISEVEVHEAITKLKRGKAAGHDAWTNELIKHLAPESIQPLTRIINTCFESSCYPEDWKLGMLIPFYKGKGSIADPNNFRGISLLSVFHKIVSRILERRLRLWAEDRDILLALQGGFRTGKSTVEQVFVLDTLMTKYCRLNSLRSIRGLSESLRLRPLAYLVAKTR
jgi:hypothetical protein